MPTQLINLCKNLVRVSGTSIIDIRHRKELWIIQADRPTGMKHRPTEIYNNVLNLYD